MNDYSFSFTFIHYRFFEYKSIIIKLLLVLVIIMNHSQLIGKIAADKDNKKLGRICRIESLPGKTIKKTIPYAMIVVHKFLQKSVVVPIIAEKVTKVEGTYVWFDITKSEFTEELMRIGKISTEREIYTGTHRTPRERSLVTYGYDHSGQSKKSKERRK